jgi:hypothetical protein
MSRIPKRHKEPYGFFSRTVVGQAFLNLAAFVVALGGVLCFVACFYFYFVPWIDR